MNTNFLDRIISITELRRNFGQVTSDLAKVESIILTRGGEPFAILKAVPSEKKKVIKKLAGVWKNTELDNDSLWKEVFKRKSRKTPIRI